MSEPILHIGDVPTGVHQMDSDRVPEHVDVPVALW